MKTAKFRRITGLILTLAFTALLCGPAWATGRSRPHLLQEDADAITALGVIGVQAEVWDGARSWTVTSGRADLRSGTPMPEQGRFRIASTRKNMVAVVVLQLAAERRLKLGDTVEKWLPGVVRGNGNDGRRITLAHLLRNTSGLHDDLPGYTTPQEYLEQRYDVHTRDELIARSLRHRPDFAPGTGWAYSNTGYLLLDALIERVENRPLEQVLRRRIVQPLGLSSVSWPAVSPILPEPSSRAYQQFESGDLVDVTRQVPGDPGAVVATTRDLNVYFRALLGGQLLPPAQLRAMLETVPVNPAIDTFYPGARYGLGLISRPLPCGGVFWGHDGGDAGSITVTGVSPDGRRSIMLTMNTALGGSPDGPLRQQRAADRMVTHALCGP